MGKKADQVLNQDEVEFDEVEDEVELDDVEVEDEESEAEDHEEDEDEESESGKKKSSEASEDGDDEVIITIGDETPKEDTQVQAPEWVRELRKSHRESQRENRELKERLKKLESPEPKPAQLGPKPKLEDLDYDTDKFEQELTAWYDRKKKADESAKAEQDKQREAEQAWNEKLKAYNDSRANLKVKDFDDAESVILEMFNQTQQGIVVQGAENPAVVFYAIGKNPDRAKELASIKDPVKFAFAVAKLEKDLKVKNRKAPPPPEKTVSGTAPKSGTVDSTLERLRVEAERTGNYSKVHKYKQQLRAKK